MTEQLKQMTADLVNKERMSYAINAFASLVDTYDLQEHIQDIAVKDLPQLIDAVERSIIETVRDFKANKEANTELHEKLTELFKPKDNAEAESDTY